MSTFRNEIWPFGVSIKIFSIFCEICIRFWILTNNISSRANKYKLMLTSINAIGGAWDGTCYFLCRGYNSCHQKITLFIKISIIKVEVVPHSKQFFLKDHPKSDFVSYWGILWKVGWFNYMMLFSLYNKLALNQFDCFFYFSKISLLDENATYFEFLTHSMTYFVPHAKT